MTIQKKPPKGRCGSWIRCGALASLLLAAALLLWQGATQEAPPQQPAASPAASPAPAPRANERTAREAAYDKDIAALRALVQSEAADPATRTQAAEHIDRLVGDHQSELGVEAALHSAGFTDCAVLIQNGAMTVIVNAPDQEKSAAILALCTAHTDVGVENIRIMARGA